MFTEKTQSKRIIEASLIVICAALTLILFLAMGYKLIVLNLFYLPIVLAAFYLGRLRAGVLALLSVLLATVVAAADLSGFSGNNSELAIAISLIVWASVMGLNALFVGTLSDERGRKINELHDAYLGVVEVLARYLKSADPDMNDTAKRVSIISQQVARRMRLSEREVDDIRVAALLQDIDNIEITARVIHAAVDDVQSSSKHRTNTFQGGDLVQSLGSVLTNALPLIISRSSGIDAALDTNSQQQNEQIGAAIIRTVRQYDALTSRSIEPLTPLEAIAAMQVELEDDYHPGVLQILEQFIHRPFSNATDRIHSDALLQQA